MMTFSQIDTFYSESRSFLSAGRILARREASLLASSVVLVIVGPLLLLTHTIVLPSRGLLTDVLNLTMSLTRFGPAFAITLLSSPLASATSLFLKVMEFLRTLVPLLEWLMFFTIVVTVWWPALKRWRRAPRAQSFTVTI